ncbi:neutral cholesterol ester hydrolase 1-like [Patiria miniata]|uniref:Alpha/beta hydrolase fold-3 domain-containing protein n=1 Tax=Patiria miniata TaxID=46514 RepID=A0A913ZGI0_PATMI|nr:neutral cholesterol ester hydrolase 1-like [Patiria miniata]
MNSSWVILTVLLAYVCFKLYTPVPDAIEEKLKFRAFVALPRIFRFVGSVIGLFNGKNSLQNMQELSAFLPRPPFDVEGSNIRSEVVTFDGVRVLLYEPINRKGRGAVGGLMFYHGGGYMLGSPETHDGLTRQIAEELDVVVASVEYRLATEQAFPAAHEDCMTALRYFLNHAADFGVDPSRIGVAGDSAGGHLAAAVAQEATDDASLPRLRLQVLLYPLLQLLDLNTPSYQQYRSDFGPNGGVVPRNIAGVFRSFLLFGRQDDAFVEAMMANNHTSLAFKKSNPHIYNHELVPKSLKQHASYKGPVVDTGNDELWSKHKYLFLDPRTSPGWRGDLSGMPQAYIMSCQYDGLRDDAVMYAARLEQAGVKVQLTNRYNGWHGMLNAQTFNVAQRALKHLIVYLKENL